MTGYDRAKRGFDVLESEIPQPYSIRTTPIGTASEAGDIRLGKDSDGVMHLLVVSPEGFAHQDPRLGPVFPAKWDSLVPSQGQEIWVLDIACKDQRFMPTFHSLVGELLDRVEESGRQGIVELFEVIESWRRAIESVTRRLSKTVEVGLFGELVVLKEMAIVRPDDVLESWRGGENYRHDFSLTNSIEVKSYTGSGSPKVQIHGARQLDPSPSGTLHLVAIQLEEAASGKTCEDLILEISTMVPEAFLRDKLKKDQVAGAKEHRRFEVIAQRIYEVDERFPGIRESQLAPHTLLGVENLSYTLLLDACPPPTKTSTLTEILRGL